MDLWTHAPDGPESYHLIPVIRQFILWLAVWAMPSQTFAVSLRTARIADFGRPPAIQAAIPGGKISGGLDAGRLVASENLLKPALEPEKLRPLAADGLKSAVDDDFSARLGETASDAAEPVEIIVTVPPAAGLSRDISREQAGQSWALRAVARVGVARRDLRRFHANLVGAVAKVETIVFKVSPERQSDFIDFMRSKGYGARVGEIYRVPAPIDTSELRAQTVGLERLASILRADRLQKKLKKALGEPRPGIPGNPELPWAIIDTWVWSRHPFLMGRFVKEVDNSMEQESHGTHVAGTVLGIDIFNFSGRIYNIFRFGSATEGDILLKLNAAQTDGALATTNSWGNNRGDPANPAARLFVRQAAEGMHHGIAACNEGPDPNSIGGPGIAAFSADLVIGGASAGRVKRIKTVAAADSKGATAKFSSRGPGSHVTAGNPDLYPAYPLKPDQAGMGVNLLAPASSGDTVGELNGPGQVMSGTSMSTPGVFGSLLLLTRGILVLLADRLPALPERELKLFAMDVASFSLTRAARRFAPAEEQGDGFVDVWAAYKFAAKLLKSFALAS